MGEFCVPNVTAEKCPHYESVGQMVARIMKPIIDEFKKEFEFKSDFPSRFVKRSLDKI